MADPTTPQPSPDREVLLRTVALALIARLVIRPADQRQPAPEEQYLHDQRFRLASLTVGDRSGDDWPALLRGYLRKPSRRDRPLVELGRHLGLVPVELLAVALALAVEDDPWVGRVLAYVQAPVGGSRPTLGLLDTAFTPLAAPAGRGNGAATRAPWVAGAIASGAAVASGLLQRLNEAAPLPEQALRVPTPLALALAGERFTWPGQVTVDGGMIPLPASLRETACRHAASLASTPGRVLVVLTPSLREGASIVDALAGALKLVPLILQGDRVELGGLGPLCRVRRCLPVLRYELGPGEQKSLPELAGYDGPLVVLKGPDGTVITFRGSLLEWEAPVPGREERAALWSRHFDDDELVVRLAEGHLHGAGRIAELAAVSRHRAELRGAAAPSWDDVRHAAWGGEGGGMGALAQPIPDRIEDDALVLSPATRQDLELLLMRCKLRESLADNMGVTLTARYRVGVRSLLVGPSGTGKTLAGAWLATKLGMPLFGVDLAAVTSKYIGETEKNLATLLARAEQSDVILLFDEADSLFGKRTDIKEANDRFANAQTNYLLQRIENYRGIVILTSNSRNRFDAAFTRRIDLIIDFPVPGPEERRDLWRAHLGVGHDLSGGELNRISASADICGGHIRNAVLTAAVVARKSGQRVGFADIVEGLKVEYRKLGKQIPVELLQVP